MIFKPHHNYKTFVYQPKLKGSGIGSVLLDGGMGGQSSYSSIQDYQHTTSGRGLEAKVKGTNALGEKLAKLVIKQPKQKKPENIKFNL